MTGKITKLVNLAVALATLFTLGPDITQAIDKMPAEIAGTISQPTGQLAFIRDKSVWIMNVNGSGQKMVQDAQNADGRLSWSPDNRRIMFSRSGTVDLKGPDMLGGFHKVYDLFIVLLDSVDNGNTFFYYRPLDDLGSRNAQWTADNKIIFYKDMNANILNAGQPNYQLCRMAPDGSDFELLRKDWQFMEEIFLTSPSISADGLWAFEVMQNMQRLGLAVLPEGRLNMPLDSIVMLANENLKLVSPGWSPDGKWVAYVKNSMNDGGLYIASADLKEKYKVFDPPPSAYLYPVAPSFSPDSKWLTFSTTDGSVWICDITGNGVRRVSGPGQDKWPAWSN